MASIPKFHDAIIKTKMSFEDTNEPILKYLKRRTARLKEPDSQRNT